MKPSPFAVAGMASTSSHNQNLNAWAGGGASTSSNSFTDTLSQSRSHYQPGYLMSASQSNNSPTGAQRVDEAPVVQTKAKMNNAFSRGPSTAEFGLDSMFQSSRQRQTIPDEDAPPMNSVNDIPTEMYADTRPPTNTNSSFARPRPKAPTLSTSTSTPTHYIIVFGYPPDKYSLAVEYFSALASNAVTPPDPHAEITNCFRMGYSDAADAMRAVRKNGEVLGGSWMVGAKWADPTAAEALLSQPVSVPRYTSPPPDSMGMAVDSPSPQHNNNNSAAGYGGATVGTPIRLAPSASAFRAKGGAGAGASAKPAPAPSWGAGAGRGAPVPANGASAGAGAGKGVLGQVSDMIFGW
ncbi:hypothetical protein B0H16DRAFT_1545424 [Mycena metata]|uniref:RRM Nup35-type domain-containing protein n=1 Tax=Mycena metata TaxID=1033252 RepID=A0AAD7NB66_9AGAR|nr:hypothetical protein B0H16DRAFT_1545424 [Mycena metata]